MLAYHVEHPKYGNKISLKNNPSNIFFVAVPTGLLVKMLMSFIRTSFKISRSANIILGLRPM